MSTLDPRWRASSPSALAIAILAVVVSAGNDARADNVPVAAARFAAGTEAFERKEYAVAAVAFEEAFKNAPRGAALHNAALSWEAANEPGRAADLFAAVLERTDLPPPQRLEAVAHLDALRKRLGRLRVEAPGGARISVAHVTNAPAATTVVHVTPGAHQVTITLEDGSIENRTASVQAGAEIVVTMQPGSKQPPSKRDVSIETAAASSQTTPDSSSTTTTTPFFSTTRIVGVAALGGSLLMAATAGVTWSQATSARDEFNASGFTSADAHDRASSWQTVTNVAWGAAGVLVVAGAAILIVSFVSPTTTGSRATTTNALLTKNRMRAVLVEF